MSEIDDLHFDEHKEPPNTEELHDRLVKIISQGGIVMEGVHLELPDLPSDLDTSA